MTIPRIWRVKFNGWSNIDPKQHYVIISNHISIADGLFLFLLPNTKTFIVAQKFYNLPLVKYVFSTCKYYPVAKEDNNTTNGIVEKIYEDIKDKSSIVLFPEGQRNTKGGAMLQFKSGAFRLAKDLNYMILPIRIKGTDKAIPNGGINCYSADIDIIVGKPYTCYNLSVEEIKYYSYEYITKM